MTVDTKTIIKKISKERFGVVGLKQKGQSRMWYFPGDYYLILVEFQPSSWDTGTYLNVGLDFNWYPKDYFSFEFGHRVSDFKKLANENQFETEVRQLCDLAIKKVTQYKDIFTDRQSLGDKLLKLHSDKTNDWEKFHIGMAYGLAGNVKKAIDYLSKVSGDKYQLDWEKERATIAREYILALETGDFLTKLNETIQRTKELKRVG
jgi:hypothetical protein